MKYKLITKPDNDFVYFVDNVVKYRQKDYWKYIEIGSFYWIVFNTSEKLYNIMEIVNGTIGEKILSLHLHELRHFEPLRKINLELILNWNNN